MAVSMIIVLKIACSGMTAGIYFSSKSKKQGFSIVMISMAYALSSYMVGYCWNVNVVGCHNDIPDHHDGIGAAHRKKGWKTVLHRTVLCAVL